MSRPDNTRVGAASVGAASRGDYAQEVLYNAIEHMDVRRDCVIFAHSQKSIAARRGSHSFNSHSFNSHSFRLHNFRLHNFSSHCLSSYNSRTHNQFVAKEVLNELF